MENRCCDTCGTDKKLCPLKPMFDAGNISFNRDSFSCSAHSEKQLAYQPCPFCGSTNVTSEVDNKRGKAYIFCVLCGAIGPVCKGKAALSRSVDAWNERVAGQIKKI